MKSSREEIFPEQFIIKKKEPLEVLKSSNKLNEYIPIICLCLITIFAGWYILWYTYFTDSTYVCYLSKFKNNRSTYCQYDITFDFDTFELFSYMTSGVFVCLIAMHLVQSIDNYSKTANLRDPVNCTLIINVIAFLTHFSMAKGWFPMVISSWGRVSHMSRWGEWLSVSPALMIMLHSPNIHNDKDKRLLWESTAFQCTSVLLGAISSSIQNISLSLFLLTISLTFFCHIYYVAYRSYKSYLLVVSTRNFKRMTLFQDSKINKESNYLRRNFTFQKINSSNDFESNFVQSNSGLSSPIGINSNKFPLNKETVSSRQIIEEFEVVGAIISIKLAVWCTLTWTVKVLIFSSGTMGLISNTTEAILHSVFDCVCKGLYARALSFNRIPDVGGEEIIGKISIIEEQANASIRQFLRFVFHEISTPLNTLSMCISNLQDEQLPRDLQEIIDLAKEGCNHINETLHDLLNFQEVEEGSFVMKTSPVQIKDLIRNVSNQFADLSRERGLTFLQSIDSKIPDVVLADMTRLKQVFIVLMQHCIENANSECAISVKLINLGKYTALIRLSFREDSDGYTSEDIDRLFNPYGSLSYGNEKKGYNIGIGLCVAKQIIELHGGVLTVDSVITKNTTFNCDILFSLPKHSKFTEITTE